MLSETARNAALDRAVEAAAVTLDRASKDAAERAMMWRLYAGGCFLSVLTEATEEDQLSIVTRINDGLERENSPWRMVKSDG